MSLGERNNVHATYDTFAWDITTTCWSKEKVSYGYFQLYGKVEVARQN